MAYTSKKAMGRDSQADRNNPVADERKDAKLGKAQSNQERATGDGSRTVSVSPGSADGNTYMSTHRTTGNQLRVGANSKGTGKLKEPTAVALGSKTRTYAASTNPDPVANRAGRNVAPKKGN